MTFWFYLSIYLSICPIVLETVGAPHDLATNIPYSSRSSALLTASLSSKPVQSQMLSSHRFLCVPLLLPPRTVPWRTVLASPRSSCDMPIPLHFASFYSGQEFFVGSNGFPNPASHIFVGDVVFVRDAKETSETSHCHCLYLSHYFCC